MTSETILNQEDATCDNCGHEIPKGTYAQIDPKESNLIFCDNDMCWVKYFEVENEEDPYQEVMRDSMRAMSWGKKDIHN